MSGFFNPFGCGSSGGGGGGTTPTGSPVYYGTVEYFNSQPDLIAQVGALYVYLDGLDYNGRKVPRLKFGNGSTLIDLPFIDQTSSTPPIHVEPEHEALVDDGDQDIFYSGTNEQISFGNGLLINVDEGKEQISINY